MNTCVVIDDEPSVRFMLREVLEAQGYAVREFADGGAALAAFAALEEASAVLTDLAMPGVDGMAVLGAMRERAPEVPVIVLTARGSERAAVAAMKAGAYDYLAKPADIEELERSVARAVEARLLRSRIYAHEIERAVGRPLIAESSAMQRLVREATRVAKLGAPVLLRGETGTGKELIATLVHGASGRAKGPLVRFNCAAIADELAESELFGHARGAFTGAIRAHEGFFARAHGGTLVLDEVAELSPSVQAKLLRALQSGEVQPVGAGRVETVDVRVIASTHRDLRAEVRAGRFREDLYFRLAVVELVIPPLRERAEDIEPLIEAVRQRLCREYGVGDVRFDRALLRALEGHDWPGNVRELENAVARLLAFATGDEVGLDALARAVSVDPSRDERGSDEELPLRERVARFEASALEGALRACDGNQSEAARRLGITRASLIDKCKRYGVALGGRR